jgi:hypothetical protein
MLHVLNNDDTLVSNFSVFSSWEKQTGQLEGHGNNPEGLEKARKGMHLK